MDREARAHQAAARERALRGAERDVVLEAWEPAPPARAERGQPAVTGPSGDMQPPHADGGTPTPMVP